MICKHCNREVKGMYFDGEVIATVSGIKHNLTIYEEDKVIVEDKDFGTIIRNVAPIVKSELHSNIKPSIDIKNFDFTCPLCGCEV